MTDLSAIYQATWAPGAFDGATADDVYGVADALGAEYGPVLRDDVHDRYAGHVAESISAQAWSACDREAAARSDAAFDGVAETLGLSRSDVDSAVADALEGRPLAFDRMMADYYGR